MPSISSRLAFVDFPDPEGPHMKITRLTRGPYAPPSSLSSVEGDLAGRGVGGGVALVVGQPVMSVAEQAAVVEAGGTTARPRDVVVGVTQARWHVAPVGGAAAVAQCHREALGLVVQAAGAAALRGRVDQLDCVATMAVSDAAARGAPQKVDAGLDRDGQEAVVPRDVDVHAWQAEPGVAEGTR